MQRRFLTVSAIAVVLAAACLTGSGVGSSAAFARDARTIPGGLASAIHARFGLGPIRLADSPTEHPYLGFSVAMSGDGTTALVGAVGAGNGKGAAYIYHVASAGSWVSASTPTATLAGAAPGGLGEALGWSVALSADGTTAFVSAPFRFNATTLGDILVFHVANEGAWASTSTPTAILTTDDANLFGDSAMAVSSDGTTLVVGEAEYNNYAGGARVFHVANESAWVSTSTPTATLDDGAEVSPNSSVGYTGIAISSDGTTALLSDPLGGNGAGGAYVFHAASEGAWATSSAPTAFLSNASGGAKDHLGGSLALSGDGTTAFLAAPDANSHKGAVDVYQVADEGSWASSSAPAATLTNGSASAHDLLGVALVVSADGTTAVANAPGAKKFTGATYVFHAPAENQWASTTTPTAVLTNSAGVAGDERGEELAISPDGMTALLGSPLVNWRTGTVDVFHVADAGSWAASSTPTAALTNSALPKPLCVVPNLKKYKVPVAKEVLDDANCRLGKVKKVHSTKKNRNKVVSQSPAPRHRLKPGSKVNVKIGK